MPDLPPDSAPLVLQEDLNRGRLSVAPCSRVSLLPELREPCEEPGLTGRQLSTMLDVTYMSNLRDYLTTGEGPGRMKVGS